ncbi:MAG: hypothetical protein WKF84_18290 [Pyrinomonadaceae bacterium]
MHKYIWIIPLLPLAGAVINGLLGRYLRFSERAVASIAVGSVALALSSEPGCRGFIRLRRWRGVAEGVRDNGRWLVCLQLEFQAALGSELELSARRSSRPFSC